MEHSAQEKTVGIISHMVDTNFDRKIADPFGILQHQSNCFRHNILSTPLISIFHNTLAIRRVQLLKDGFCDKVQHYVNISLSSMGWRNRRSDGGTDGIPDFYFVDTEQGPGSGAQGKQVIYVFGVPLWS